MVYNTRHLNVHILLLRDCKRVKVGNKIVHNAICCPILLWCYVFSCCRLAPYDHMTNSSVSMIASLELLWLLLLLFLSLSFQRVNKNKSAHPMVF